MHIAAEVRDFEPKRHVSNRKQLKVMCRDAQLGVAAAELACREAHLSPGAVDAERFGVVLGADRICNSMDASEPAYRACMSDGQFDFRRWGSEGMAASFPLGFLKVLPNMIASHISIAEDARGPNNTIHQAEVSSLLAVAEALSVIRRGAADIVLAGGASSMLHPFDYIRHSVMGTLSRNDDPTTASRPFDAGRDGQVLGEGSAVFVLERYAHARARGVPILARVRSAAAACDGRSTPRGDGLRRAMQQALDRAGLENGQVGHVNAHGLSAQEEDRIEAQVICQVAPDAPVTAPKSYFANLGAAGGAMEMAVSVLALSAGCVPPTLNYEHPDPSCPVRVIRGAPLACNMPSALVINRTTAGQAAAVVLTAGELG